MSITRSMIALLLVACARAPTPPPEAPMPQLEPAPANPTPATSQRCERLADGASTHQAHLDAVASCFHAAVLALNREPEEGETLEAFMAAAELPGTPLLVLDDGAAVTIEVVDRWHDDLMGGGATFGTTYRFSAPGHEESAARSIELMVGGGE